MPESTLAREGHAVAMTEAGDRPGAQQGLNRPARQPHRAGRRIRHGTLSGEVASDLANTRLEAPRRVNKALATESEIEAVARGLMSADDVLYLRRSLFFPLLKAS